MNTSQSSRKSTHLIRFLSKQLFREPSEYELEQFEITLHHIVGDDSNWFPEHVCIQAFNRLIDVGFFHPLYTRYIPRSVYDYTEGDDAMGDRDE